jgi:hypothetical protein
MESWVGTSLWLVGGRWKVVVAPLLIAGLCTQCSRFTENQETTRTYIHTREHNPCFNSRGPCLIGPPNGSPKLPLKWHSLQAAVIKAMVGKFEQALVTLDRGGGIVA